MRQNYYTHHMFLKGTCLFCASKNHTPLVIKGFREHFRFLPEMKGDHFLHTKENLNHCLAKN